MDDNWRTHIFLNQSLLHYWKWWYLPHIEREPCWSSIQIVPSTICWNIKANCDKSQFLWPNSYHLILNLNWSLITLPSFSSVSVNPCWCLSPFSFCILEFLLHIYLFGLCLLRYFVDKWTWQHCPLWCLWGIMTYFVTHVCFFMSMTVMSVFLFESKCHIDWSFVL